MGKKSSYSKMAKVEPYPPDDCQRHKLPKKLSFRRHRGKGPTLQDFPNASRANPINAYMREKEQPDSSAKLAVDKKMVDEIIKDRISDLPDEILSSILWLLTMRETAKTSELSRRWRYLFRTSMAFISSLNFDVANMRGSNYPDREFRKDITGKYSKETNLLLREERCKFVRWVDQILEHHQGPEIDAFRVRFYLDEEFAHHIDQWIRIAIAKRVQKLDLNLLHFDGGGVVQDDKLYDFPSWLFAQEMGSSLKYFNLRGCILSPPLDFNGFSSLVVLTLGCVDIDDEHIVNLLSNSSNLERLSVLDCSKLVNLKITGSSLRLKFLIIFLCTYLEKVEIFDIHLTTFEYCGAMVKFSFQNVPRLVNTVIRTVEGNQSDGVTYALGGLASDLPQLESLLLFCFPIEESMIPARLPLFTNLKQLVLEVCWLEQGLLGFISILQAAPYLHRFELLLGSTRPKKAGSTWKPSKCTHLHLKEVELNGFGGSREEIKLAKYLLSNAIVLKTMTIHRQVKHYLTGKGFMSSGFLEELNVECVLDQLEKVRPQGVELTIM